MSIVLERAQVEHLVGLYAACNMDLNTASKEMANTSKDAMIEFVNDHVYQTIPWVCRDKAKRIQTRDIAKSGMDRGTKESSEGNDAKGWIILKETMNSILLVLFGPTIHNIFLDKLELSFKYVADESKPSMSEMMQMLGPRIIVAIKMELNKHNLYRANAQDQLDLEMLRANPL